MAGIEETKDVLKTVIGLGNGVGKALEDGKIGFDDIGQVFGPIMSIPAAFKGIDQVPGELADLDADERAELIAYVNGEFDLPQEDVEEIVEEALALAAQLYAFIQKVIG